MITRKIKIGNFFYSLPRSIQSIAHHFQSLFDGVISEGGGVCMSFFDKIVSYGHHMQQLFVQKRCNRHLKINSFGGHTEYRLQLYWSFVTFHSTHGIVLNIAYKHNKYSPRTIQHYWVLVLLIFFIIWTAIGYQECFGSIFIVQVVYQFL